jgi:hypothetical protein
MAIFNCWRSQKLLEHGDQRAEAARRLLHDHRARLSAESRDQADGLLTE